MTHPFNPKFTDAAQFFMINNISLVDFLVAIIQGDFGAHDVALHGVSEQLCHPQSLNRLASALITITKTHDSFSQIARNIAMHKLVDEITGVIEKSSGYQYNPSHMTPQKILQFSREDMAMDLQNRCPQLWCLVQLLLNTPAVHSAIQNLEKSGDYLTSLHLETPATGSKAPTMTISAKVTNAAGIAKIDSVPTVRPRQVKSEKVQILQSEQSIVRGVSIISIFMQNSNSRCNQLQTLVGLFTHSTHTPEKVVELLAHAGLSISPSSINNMVQSMSESAASELKNGPPDEVKAFGFDNLDINFKTGIPTVDYQGNMAHITTAALIPVIGATHNDMRVSKEIWEKQDINPENPPGMGKPTHKNLMPLFAPMALPPDHPQSLESRMAWHTRKFLLLDCVSTLKPAIKDKLRAELGLPPMDTGRSIPIVKLNQRPTQAMHINPGTNSGTGAAVENLMRQGGIEESYLDEHVVLLHADLGTGDHLYHLQKSRSIEKTPQNRLQYAQWIPGFFHIEMAITDTIWRLYLKHQDTDSGKPLDPHSIFYLCGLTRPREIKKLATGPDHRMTHHTIYTTLVALVVEAWSVSVKAKYGMPLNEWEPEWDDVIEMSREVVRNYVADLRFQPTYKSSLSTASDMVNDATKLFVRDTLLWVIVRHAARHGDVGCIEDILPFWIPIWKHTGKHKYAEHIARFLLNLQKTWPPCFAAIIRKNWLVNPSGTVGGFRGMDWVIERNNLMHKVIHAGGSSNRTLENIIKESPLIEIYRLLYNVIETTFNMTRSTLYHPPPPMDNTLAMLRETIRMNEFHSHIHGRTVSTPPLNAVVEGLLLGTCETPMVETNDANRSGFDEGDEYSDIEFDLASVLAGNDNFEDME